MPHFKNLTNEEAVREVILNPDMYGNSSKDLASRLNNLMEEQANKPDNELDAVLVVRKELTTKDWLLAELVRLLSDLTVLQDNDKSGLSNKEYVEVINSINAAELRIKNSIKDKYETLVTTDSTIGPDIVIYGPNPLFIAYQPIKPYLEFSVFFEKSLHPGVNETARNYVNTLINISKQRPVVIYHNINNVERSFANIIKNYIDSQE